MASLGVTGKIRYSAADEALLNSAMTLASFVGNYADSDAAKEAGTNAVRAIAAVTNHIHGRRNQDAKPAAK